MAKVAVLVPNQEMSTIAKSLTGEFPSISMMAIESIQTGYCLARRDGDVRALTKALNAALNGRGGGKPGICQGSCAATPEQVERFLKENNKL